MDRDSKTLENIEVGIISILFITMPILTFIDVMMRFLLNLSFSWIDEVTLNIMAWFVLFGASYLVKDKGHIGVSFIVDRLGPAKRRLMGLFAVICCIFYCSVIMVGGFNYLTMTYNSGLGMADTYIPTFLIKYFDGDMLWNIFRIDVERSVIPLWFSRSILIIGFFILGVRFLSLGYQLLIKKVDRFGLGDEARSVLDEAKIMDRE